MIANGFFLLTTSTGSRSEWDCAVQNVCIDL